MVHHHIHNLSHSFAHYIGGGLSWGLSPQGDKNLSDATLMAKAARIFKIILIHTNGFIWSILVHCPFKLSILKGEDPAFGIQCLPENCVFAAFEWLGQRRKPVLQVCRKTCFDSEGNLLQNRGRAKGSSFCEWRPYPPRKKGAAFVQDTPGFCPLGSQSSIVAINMWRNNCWLLLSKF